MSIVLFLFRLPLFFGYRFVGNSDRWNHHLSFVAFHSDNLRNGGLSAWSEYLLMGFDTLASPGNFPTPLFALPAMLQTTDVVAVFAYVAAALLALALVLAYLVVFRLCNDHLAAVAGAVVFGLSTFSLLKLSQNDNEFLPLALSPLFFYLVSTADVGNAGRRILFLTLLVWACVYVSFLQPFAYIVLFISVYAVYRAMVDSRIPLVVTTASLALGVLLGASRILIQFEDVMRSSRTGGGIIEQVSPVLLLRYFDANIFGRSWREAYNHTTVNLSEGNLLFASIFASLLLCAIVLRGRYGVRIGGDDGTSIRIGFFVGFILFVFVVIHFESAYRAFALLFLNISFLHTRFSQAALLPIAVVTALALTRPPTWKLTTRRALLLLLLAGVVLLLDFLDFDSLARLVLTWLGRPPNAWIRVPGSVEHVLAGEFLRWIVLAAVFALLLLGTRRPLNLLDAALLRTLLAIAIVGQSVAGADHFLNGPHTRTYVMPFERYDSVMAQPTQFHSPSPKQLSTLHQMLSNESYRSLIVCPETITRTECSTSIGMRWHLRLVDGYLNAVSKRYLSMPWPERTSSGRSIRFFQLYNGRDDTGSWKLLSFLNVRNVLFVTPELLMNANFRVPDDVIVATNPSPYVYPRVYLASHVMGVTETQAVAAIREVFAGCGPQPLPPCAPLLLQKHPIDYVEGPVEGDFDAEGTIVWRFNGDGATFALPPSPRPRFLVVNEAYSHRWTAHSATNPLTIYPTNVVMRGVLVPPGVSNITMRYRSVLDDTWKYLGVVLPILGGSGFLLRRRVRLAAHSLLGASPPEAPRARPT